MKSLSSLGLGLSLVFGCLLLALIAELYYLLWWKKRIINREFFHWKKPSSLSSAALDPKTLCSSDTQVHEPQAQSHSHGDSNKDFWYNKPFGEDCDDDELMRLQSITGPPRFLFTIKEETKEDLESDDGKSRGDRSRKGSRSRSLSDLFHIVETPYLTPIASPPYFTPPLTPVRTSHGSFFGSESEAEFNWLRSSPPPNFHFFSDADDKLHRRNFTGEIELEKGVQRSDEESISIFHKDDENGPFITLLVGHGKNTEEDLLQYTPNSSQVLPLASSPPTALKLTSTGKSMMPQKIHQMN